MPHGLPRAHHRYERRLRQWVRFRARPLRQFQQFVGGDARFVISGIVEEEILKRLREMNTSTRDKLNSVIKDALDRGVLPGGSEPQIDAVRAVMTDPKASARGRLDTFIAATGAVIVPVDLAQTVDITRLYFDAAAPFEPAGTKKAEFPDAIALLSLEAWAKRNGKVLAVSKDKGWRAFAEGSPFLDVVDDLADALAVFQEQAAADKATTVVAAILARIEAGELPDLATALKVSLEAETENLEPDIEANSYHEFESEFLGVLFSDYEFAEAAGTRFDITVVRLEDDLVAVTVPVVLHARVEASFRLLHWDPIDREYVSLGSQMEGRDVALHYDVLITLTGDLAAPDTLDVDEVELVNGSPDVNFGEIELDVGDRY